jgi:hypothetical protein
MTRRCPCCCSFISALAVLATGVAAWGSADPAADTPGGPPRSTQEHSRPELTSFPYMGRGDFHHSFAHPYVPSADSPIANWNQIGSAVITSVGGRDVVRLVNGAQGLQGMLMSTMHTETNNFNGYFDVKITTHPASAEAADGMGFFFADSMNGKGSAMGMDERFRGLGIIIDTFANSRLVKVPYMYSYVSNGDKPWDAGTDGKDMQLTAGCKLPLNTPIRVFVQLLDSNLHVAVSLNRDHHSWHTCFRYNNVPMPFKDGGFMSFAGETGHFYASHDVLDAAFVVGDAFVANTETRSHIANPEQEQQRAAASRGEAAANAGNVAAGKKEASHDAFEGHIDQQVDELYKEVSGLMMKFSGGSFSEAESMRASFQSLASLTSHSFAEVDRMTAETKDVKGALERMKQTSIDLHAYAERFSATLKSLHDSVRSLRASNNQLRGKHEETSMLVNSHSGLMHNFASSIADARPHGFTSIIVFIVVQIMLLAGFAVVAKMGPAARKMGRIV